MARRKATEDVQVAAPVLPERLRACFIEDWIKLDHEPEPYRSAEDVGEVIWYLQIHAWGLWRRARNTWAEEQGVDWREMSKLYPVAPGRWRFRGGAQELIDAIGPRLIREDRR